MSPRKRYTFWIDDDQTKHLEAIRRRDGILPSEQIRRALDAWIAGRRLKKAGRKRAVTRKRP